ncbi:hypothetical protein HYU17_04990 [Candidatus Woesearchaeota archaeon]|nr:hypothetical protein [Candidatus Woesearchaeota archaeon]
MRDIFGLISGISMDIFPKYRNKELKATKEAVEELGQLNCDLWDAVEILDKGYNCARSRRKENVVENCLRKGDDVYKAVVADCGDYLLLIHFGKFSYKRR